MSTISDSMYSPASSCICSASPALMIDPVPVQWLAKVRMLSSATPVTCPQHTVPATPMDGLALGDALRLWLGLMDGDTLALLLIDRDTDGLTEGLTEWLGLTDLLTLGLTEGLTLALLLIEGLTDGDTLGDWLRVGLALGLTLAE